MAKFKFYDVERTIADYPQAQYYVIYGERSNGKTYSSLLYCIKNYVERREQFAYVRRMGEDIRRATMLQLFAAHGENGTIERLTHGEWTGITYVNRAFKFCRTNDKDKLEVADEPIGFAFDLSGMEHRKSISYPRISTIVFDEFLSRTGYLPNEFLLFTNTVSTIVRLDAKVKILMLGNTVSQYCPYFEEMGLRHIKQQKQGTIDVYTYGQTDLTVVVEYCESSAKRGGKKSDIYFAFDNPELQMITEGAWEIAVYPHLEYRYRPKDVAFQFFIEFDHELVHGEIITIDKGVFLFFHRKTTPIKNEDRDLVYTTRASQRDNYKMAITKQSDKASKTICRLITENRAFYSTNEVGEIVRNYLKWSMSYSVLN